MARQGIPFVVFGAFIELLGAGAVAAGLMRHVSWLTGLGAAVFVLGTLWTVFMVQFFRDPERPLPTDLKKIWSPGDGVVISVAREGQGEEQTIRIFLSPVDVHIQRNPVSGRVVASRYDKGSFAAAMKAEANANERASLTVEVEGRAGARISYEQVTGFLVRRIESWPKVGDTVRAGERYGLMYFGSQCAVHLPKNARPLVQKGDRVKGGLDPIAEWIG